MRRAIFVLVLLLASVGGAWAGTQAYKLVMSKDKDVCTSMLALFNTEMKQHSEIRYDKLANFVRWEPVELEGKPPIARGCSVFLKSKFDINNDGKDELVIKWRACLSSQLTDSLYIFPADSDVLTKVSWQNHEALFKAQDKLELAGKGGVGYDLKELPEPLKQQLLSDLRQQMSESIKKGLVKEEDLAPAGIGGVLILQPFVWKRIAYISMTDLHQEWIVISKYLKAEALEDVCYFQGRSRKG